jgi:hypothetical protein
VNELAIEEAHDGVQVAVITVTRANGGCGRFLGRSADLSSTFNFDRAMCRDPSYAGRTKDAGRFTALGATLTGTSESKHGDRETGATSRTPFEQTMVWKSRTGRLLGQAFDRVTPFLLAPDSTHRVSTKSVREVAQDITN